jgi:hypothetical protein
MIHVDPADEPPGFGDAVRAPGLRAIAEMVGKVPEVPRIAGRPYAQRSRKVRQSDGTTRTLPIIREEDLPAAEFPPYWTKALDDLMEAYAQICAFSCFRIHPVTGAQSVDHMAPKSRAWHQAYEWRNYRLASSLLNARKRDFSAVLDPFEVEDGWFELELVGFQVRPAPGLGPETRAQIVATIERLGLDDFRASRARDAELYWGGEISFAHLMEESPFVAAELRRQGRLNEGDT